MKARADQHQIIAGGGAVPYLAYADTLTAPDGVSLSTTLAMPQRAHEWLALEL